MNNERIYAENERAEEEGEVWGAIQKTVSGTSYLQKRVGRCEVGDKLIRFESFGGSRRGPSQYKKVITNFVVSDFGKIYKEDGIEYQNAYLSLQYKVIGLDRHGYITTVQFVRAASEKAAIDSAGMQNVNGRETKTYRAEVQA